jgi:hypothetical protein
MLFGEAVADFTNMLNELRSGSQFSVIMAMQAKRSGVEGSMHILLPYRGRDLADVDFRSMTWLRASS